MFIKKDTIHVRQYPGNPLVLWLLLQPLAAALAGFDRRYPCIRFFYRVHPPAFRPTKVNLVGVIVTSGQIFLPFCLLHFGPPSLVYPDEQKKGRLSVLQFNCRAPASHWLPYGRAS